MFVKVLLHDPKDQPLMLERGFKVSPGFVTQVAITPRYVNNVLALAGSRNSPISRTQLVIETWTCTRRTSLCCICSDCPDHSPWSSEQSLGSGTVGTFSWSYPLRLRCTWVLTSANIQGTLKPTAHHRPTRRAVSSRHVQAWCEIGLNYNYIRVGDDLK